MTSRPSVRLRRTIARREEHSDEEARGIDVRDARRRDQLASGLSPPYWDEEHAAYAGDLLFAADALLLGRKTYEVFVQSWPERAGDYADRINALPKHVASTTLEDATWNATIIDGHVATSVAELKEQPGQNILKFGTGALDRTLLEHRLVDEFHFWLFPEVAGAGDRLFDGLTTTLELLGTTRFRSGIVVLVYGPK